MNGICCYFGCYFESGHYLRSSPNRTIDRYEADRLRVPRVEALDGGYLFLPHPERVGNGALTYLPASDRTVLAWWGSPWDSRPNVNSAIIVEGHANFADVWARFAHRYPELASKLAMPNVVAGV